jgi:hypothetical protein
MDRSNKTGKTRPSEPGDHHNAWIRNIPCADEALRLKYWLSFGVGLARLRVTQFPIGTGGPLWETHDRLVGYHADTLLLV